MKNCTDFYETPQIYFVANHSISAISFVYGLIIITALILKCPKQVKHTKWSFIYFQILFTFTMVESIEGLSGYKWVLLQLFKLIILGVVLTIYMPFVLFKTRGFYTALGLNAQVQLQLCLASLMISFSFLT